MKRLIILIFLLLVFIWAPCRASTIAAISTKFFLKGTKENKPTPFIVEEKKKFISLLDNSKLSLSLKKNLFETQAPTFKRFRELLEGHSCAVVGSSSNLLNSNYGSFIDDHDVVFRINNAPVSEIYKEDIGLKTSVQYLNLHKNSKHLNIDPESDTEFVIVDSKYTKFQPLLNRYMYNSLIVNVKREKTVILKNLKMKYVDTGTKALYIAITLCQNVDAFGFGRDLNGNMAHYYNSEHVYNTDYHSPLEQQNLLDQLELEGLINLFQNHR